MWRDPIIEQIHKIRQEHAGKFNFDLKAIFADLKEQEKKSEIKLISLPVKRRSVKKEKQTVAN
jgi:hypothetical protein